MDFERIVAPSPKELFISQIVRKILAGRLRPEDKLPTERELAEKMGINRSLVHSAIEELAHIGFVRIEPRRGNFITNYAKDGDINTLMAIAKYAGGEMDTNTRISLVEARNAIVGGAMIRLSMTVTPGDLAELRGLLAAQRREAAKDTSNAWEYMLSFNLALTQLSGNSIFPLLFNSFAYQSMAIWQSCVSHWGVETIFQQEEKTIELLEAGKGHEAAMYMENIFEAFLQDAGMRR